MTELLLQSHLGRELNSDLFSHYPHRSPFSGEEENKNHEILKERPKYTYQDSLISSIYEKFVHLHCLDWSESP